jgi:hypothetical protein
MDDRPFKVKQLANIFYNAIGISYGYRVVIYRKEEAWLAYGNLYYEEEKVGP